MTSEALDGSEIRHGSKIGRFVVDGELGSGGMGVVYSAHDRELDRHVALKVLRGAIDEESRRRLLREGQAMARVTHPNVITVYEVGVEGRLVFLAQELLDDGSLRDWLERERHSQRDILDRFIAAGRGLAAAHAAGLVHRDFKPDNVLLGKDGRVRVSDFGLARSLSALETIATIKMDKQVDPTSRTSRDLGRSPMATMTRTGAVMGTPLYMSPEQHRGEPADERSDQFSYCVALYQSLYGDVPFPGKTAVAIADAVIAGRMQPPPRGHKVAARLRRILLRGLAIDPKQRYPSMDALIGELSHRPGGKLGRIGIIAAIALLVVGAVAGGYALRSRLTGRDEAPEQRTIAVLGFKNLSGDKAIDWISPAVAELLATELAQGDAVRVIPAEDATRARIDLALPDTESYSPETLRRISDRLASNAVISGSYLKGANDEVTLLAVVADTARHRTARIDVKGTTNDLAGLAKRAGAKIRDELGITTLALQKQAYDVLPKNPEAARAFIEGTNALRAFDYRTAKERLLVAMQKEPEFAPGYIALASAHEGLFEGDAARVAANKALATLKTLGIDQQQLVTGQAYEHLGETDKARDAYRRLFATNPKLDYGLALLRVQSSPDEFATTVGSVRKLGDDPRIDVLEARMELYKPSPDLKRAIELASRAAKRAVESGDVILQAEANRAAGDANMALGQLGAAADAYELARSGFEGAHDKLHGLDVLELIAAASLERGLLDDAFAKYDAVAELRLRAGQLERASIAGAAASYALALRGRLADAEKRLADASARKGQDSIAIPYVDLATAAIKWARGDAAGALQAASNCAARFAMLRPSLTILCLEINGDINVDLGKFSDARKLFEDAQASADKAANAQRSDEIKLRLAQLDLDEGSEAKAKAVIDAAKEVQASAQARGASSLEAHAWIVLAHAHLEQAASQDALSDIDKITTPPQPLPLKVKWRDAFGIAQHSLGDSETGREAIDTVRAEADKQAYIGLSFEARLARVQVLSADERKAELDALVRDAKARGFGRIAKLAENLAQPQ